MSLKELPFKFVYDSDKDNILHDFYIPALEKSIRYRRLAGSFSSSALAIAARGISYLIRNGGTMQLVAGAELRKKDIEAIMLGIKSKEEVISELLIEDLNTIEDFFVRDHVKALAWMVANDKLEMKIAIVVNNEGVPIDENLILKMGIFHPKIGIFEDSEGNNLIFGGSINESLMGWLHNDENFYVFPNWIDDYKEFSDASIEKFQTCWEGKPNKFIVLDIPTAYKHELIKIAPPTVAELNLEKWYIESKIKQGKYYRRFNPYNFQPWICQKRAIESFKNNNYNGILKMATGTGKTACALFIFQHFFNEISNNNNRIMILVPSGKDRIGGQWETFLRKHVSSYDYVFRYDSEITTEERRDMARLWKNGDFQEGNLYVVSTIQSLYRFPFNGISPDFQVADEVHEYGTIKRMIIVQDKLANVKYKLGLSATPERFYDPLGTERIMDFFGPIVYKYSIKEAQKEEKYPHAETVLANYLYNLTLCTINEKEERKVKELTQAIGRYISIENDSTISEKNNLSKKVENLLQKRAKFLKKAECKFDALKTILIEKGNTIDRCIVYCEDRDQLNKVENIFKELDISSYVKYHYRIKTRTESLELFREDNCDFILSINCLDQGIDIPTCQTLILLSASTNPRQYIQRRGRVLRNYKDKPLVQIFDILALPKEINPGYHGLIKSKLLRAWEFIDASQSPEEKAKLIDVQMNYGISSEELTNDIKEW